MNWMLSGWSMARAPLDRAAARLSKTPRVIRLRGQILHGTCAYQRQALKSLLKFHPAVTGVGRYTVRGAPWTKFVRRRSISSFGEL